MLGRRPAATSSRSEPRSSAVPPASVSDTVNRPSAWCTDPIFAPASTWMPSAAIARATTSEDSGSSRARMRGAASTSETVRAEARERLGQLGADRAAADDDHRGRQVGGGEHVAVGPERGVGQAVDRGSGRRGAGVEHDPARGGVAGAAHLDHAGVDEPPVPAHEPDPGLLEALDGDRVVPVVGGLVADPGVHHAPVGGDLGGAGEGADPAGVGEQVRGPDHHLRGDAARSRGTRRPRGARRCRRRSGRPSRPRWRGARHRARAR